VVESSQEEGSNMSKLEETLNIPLSTQPRLTADGEWSNVPTTLSDTMHHLIVEKGWVERSKLEVVNGRAQLTVWPDRTLHERYGMGPDNQTFLKSVEWFLGGHGLTVCIFDSRGNDLWVFKAAP
jgi:hypothetical protein